MDRMIRDVDTQIKFVEAHKRLHFLVNSNILSSKHYLTLSEEERFSQMMLLFSKVTPRWLANFNALEDRKPKKMRSYLAPKTTIQDLIDSALDDDLCQTAMSMYIANKLAHTCENVRNVLLEEYLKEKIETLYQTDSEKDAYKLSQLVASPKDFRYLSNTLYSYFDPTVQSKQRLLTRIQENLYRMGLDLTDLENFKKLGIDKLSDLQRNGFYIKDTEMLNLITKLQERDDISYGMVTEDMTDHWGNVILENGTPKKEHLLVVDLPYYGQFSVHMKTAYSISALSNTPYDAMRVYETESLILTPEISPIAQKDFDIKNGITMEKLKKLKKMDPRYAHYLAVKTGYTKQELDEMYDER